MSASLGLSRLVGADLRHHRGSFVGVAVAVFVASALVTGLGVLVESGMRGGLAPERYAAVDVVVGAPQQVDVPEDLPVPLRERVPLPADAVRDIAALPESTASWSMSPSRSCGRIRERMPRMPDPP